MEQKADVAESERKLLNEILEGNEVKRTIVLLNLAAFLLSAQTSSAAPRCHPYYEPMPKISVQENGGNLLVNATVSASGHWKDMTPQLAVDGKSDKADSHWACEKLPAVLDIDIGKSVIISRIRVWPYWGDGRVYQYKVEGSVDKRKWATVADYSANSITATREGNSFTFAPQSVRYFRLTVLNSSKPSAGAHIVEMAAYPETAGHIMGGIGSINVRYPQSGIMQLAPPSDGIKLTAWRGERVNAQVVVYADKVQYQLRIDPLQLETEGASAEAIPVDPKFVRYVLADGKPQADILDNETMIEQAAGLNRPVWVSIDVPATAAPGNYKGNLTIRSELGVIKFPMQVEVLSATLPPPKDWSFHLDIWQHPHAVARWHDVKLWSPEHFALMRPLMKRLADAGQKNITCSIIHEPWGSQTFDWFPSMVEWRKKTDGSWQFDYTAFDRWVGFMVNDIGISGQIVCYTMIPWQLKFRYYDEAAGNYVDVKLNPGTPEYDEYWRRFLVNFSSHLKAKGWLAKTCIGMDERPDALFLPALQTLRRHAPDLKVVSAVNHPSKLAEDVYDLSPIIEKMDSIPPELLAKRQKAGKLTTYYVCCSPRVPNTFTFSPLAEAAWLPLLSAAKGYDGFLRWAYNSWVENPLESTDFVTWPSGDCFMVYPGNRSSLRWERLRDGIEEFEKIRILRSANNKEMNADIDRILTPFTVGRSSQAGVHEADVEAAAKAVEDLSRKQ